MPELPEVETIRSGLERELTGQLIASTEILFAKSMPALEQLIADRVVGAKVSALRRRGKVMIVDLDTHYSLMVHLKMTGQLILQRADGVRRGGGHPTKSMVRELPDNSTRVVFNFRGGDRLFFNDQRKFGWIKLLPTAEVEQDSLLTRMGVEPLSTEFTFSNFTAKVARRKSPIKAVLLDQSTVAGLGNIYVDEALHLARIHPLTHGIDLSPTELRRLHQAIITIITRAIELKGTTFRNFRNHKGESGGYFEMARVFGRTNQPCPECSTPIDKLRVAGRGTHICPQCQLLKTRT
ncbi:MAG: bifunctional DNA-formamidopyrimidine glycosylase/DNA-(apurinic or apyrimidinic site) lyase [Candidatus Saccharimonadales bacterium]